LKNCHLWMASDPAAAPSDARGTGRSRAWSGRPRSGRVVGQRRCWVKRSRPVRGLGGRRRGSLPTKARSATGSDTSDRDQPIGPGWRARAGPPRRADRAHTLKATTSSNSAPSPTVAGLDCVRGYPRSVAVATDYGPTVGRRRRRPPVATPVSALVFPPSSPTRAGLTGPAVPGPRCRGSAGSARSRRPPTWRTRWGRPSAARSARRP